MVIMRVIPGNYVFMETLIAKIILIYEWSQDNDQYI